MQLKIATMEFSITLTRWHSLSLSHILINKFSKWAQIVKSIEINQSTICYKNSDDLKLDSQKI